MSLSHLSNSRRVLKWPGRCFTPRRTFPTVSQPVRAHYTQTRPTRNTLIPRSWTLKRYASSEQLATVDLTPRVTGAQLIFELLRKHKVTSCSGYSGGAVLPLIDVFASPPQGYDAIPFYLHANEAAAGHSAEAMAKVTGQLGCCVVTSGPGITNCITPMQDAKADGIPMLFISGQVPTSSVGKEAFQEVAAVEVTRPVTKWTFCVTDVRDIGWVMDRACRIATTGRPGPVHIDLPKDVLTAGVPPLYDPLHPRRLDQQNDGESAEAVSMHATGMLGSIYPDASPEARSRTPGSLHIDEHKLDAVVDLLEKCSKPLIHVGAGASEASESLRDLVQYLGIPFSSTLHGMGILSERDPMSCGMIGMHGSVYGNYALQEADLILGIGVRFDDRTTGSPATFAPKAHEAGREGRGGIIHFDIDPSMFGKSGIIPTMPILGDLKVYGPQLLKKVRQSNAIKEKIDQWKPWNARVMEWKRKYPYLIEKDPSQKMKGQEVIAALDNYLESQGLGDEKIVCTGVGNHQMYACQFMTWTRPRQFVSSGGLGTMGVGLPFTIGSKIAAPDRRVILIDGDGSFNMSSSDLQTVARYRLPCTMFLLNDGKQSMVSSWQDFFFEGRQYITTNINPDYKKLAEAHGIRAYQVEKIDELVGLFPEIFAKSRHEPVLVDCRTISDYAFPICTPGTALQETFYRLEDLQKKGTSGDAPS